LQCSRQAVTLLSVYGSTSVSVAFFASCFAVLQLATLTKTKTNNIDQSKHVCTLSDTCFFGTSIVLTEELTRWIDGCGPAETVCSYITVYVLLEAARKLGSSSDDDHDNSGGSESIVTGNDDDEGGANEIYEDKNQNRIQNNKKDDYDDNDDVNDDKQPQPKQKQKNKIEMAKNTISAKKNNNLPLLPSDDIFWF